jgi:hypothetical protein
MMLMRSNPQNYVIYSILPRKIISSSNTLFRKIGSRLIFGLFSISLSITVAARSKAFSRSNTGIVSSNHTRCMDVCVRLFYVCVVLCVGSVLATG